MKKQYYFSIVKLVMSVNVQRSRRCSEARKCAQAHLPQTQCNVPEPIPTIASPVNERKNKFLSSRKFFWSEGAGLACTSSNTANPPPKPSRLGARTFTSVQWKFDAARATVERRAINIFYDFPISAKSCSAHEIFFSFFWSQQMEFKK